MNRVSQLLKIVKTINSHPLAGRHRLWCYYRLLRWQAISRVRREGVTVPFTSQTRLSVKRGMTGATGNIYMGLHDFEEMAFLLHFLRKDDVFVDVGANVGSYTVLAAGHVGCRTIAFEPAPATFQQLQTNILLNGAGIRVNAIKAAAGSQKGLLSLTSSLDTVNHVVKDGATPQNPVIPVQVVTIDETIGEAVPALVKLDVEGFEWEALAGMKKILASSSLKAVIIELNGSGARYGYSDEATHALLIKHGFHACTYDPFCRELTEMRTHGAFNTLYLRDVAFVKARLAQGPAVTIFGETF